MGKESKSPQEKKLLEYSKNHFTFSESPHAFPRQWRRKKTHANRQYRRKSEKLLEPAKPQMSAKDAEAIVGDLTIGHLKNSITRKRLRKNSPVSVGEKVRIKLEKREEMTGRRVNSHRKYDVLVAEAVGTLISLERDSLTKFVRRASKFLQGGDPVEWNRLSQSEQPLDRALYLLERLERGDGPFYDALRRAKPICQTFQQWCKEANRILMKDTRAAVKKAQEKGAFGKNLKASLPRTNQSRLANLPHKRRKALTLRQGFFC
jgi:hypothetical protein